MKTYKRNGYTLYAQEERDKDDRPCLRIVDIDINPGVKEIKFSEEKGDDVSSVKVDLRGIDKQFPDVRVIRLGFWVDTVNVSNFMFPNVRDVYSDSWINNYPEMSDFIIRNGVLLNTFCRRADEVMYMSQVKEIAEHSMDGCSAGMVDVRHKIPKEQLLKSGYEGKKPDEERPFYSNCPCILYPETDGENVNLYIDVCGFPSGQDLTDVIYYFNDADKIIMNENPWFCVEDNVLYTKDGRVLIYCHPEKRGTFTVPDGVKIIEKESFSCCQVSQVIIPPSVAFINEQAFNSCANLERVQFSEGLEYIGYSAFGNSKMLKHVELPASLKEIGAKTFPYVESVRLKGGIPKGFISSLLLRYYEEKPLRLYGPTDWKRTIQCSTDSGLSFVVPAGMNSSGYKLNISGSENEDHKLDTLYCFVLDCPARYVAALRAYKCSGYAETKKYLESGRVAKELTDCLLENEMVEDLIDYVNSGTVSRNNMEHIFHEAQKRNLESVIPYILPQLQDQPSSVSFSL